jgi:hypothetical protein
LQTFGHNDQKLKGRKAAAAATACKNLPKNIFGRFAVQRFSSGHKNAFCPKHFLKGRFQVDFMSLASTFITIVNKKSLQKSPENLLYS